MEQLVNRIKTEAIIKNEKILDVSGFFNTRIDPQLMHALGHDFHDHFQSLEFDLYVTVESSGIAPTLSASIASQKPMVVIKKEMTSKQSDDIVQIPCYSYTKDHTFYLTVQRLHIAGKRIVLIDDFLADGNVLDATIALLHQSGAQVCGLGICIAKTFQKGYEKALNLHIPLVLQAKVLSLSPLVVE
ncbi:hypothetical protein AOC36_08050 [Erysipelothrix larvae]|uniref:Xanthine phosphoribosyltransferase n=1 Tax=Erysipelothrix larvae TaxID=1514105 RepID=A0A0X8H0P7_9FIRM|nr:hypothetical protein [Erysipelothrix larvae]AMC93939.1 hypothetical protein AOC36_08050 [Erysipelothrix larvae]